MNRANKLLFITIEEEIVAFDFNEVDIDKAVSGITNVTMSNPCVGLVVNDRNEVNIKISATIGEQIKIVYDNGVEQNLNELYNIQKMIGNMEPSIFSSILTCIDLDIAEDIIKLMHIKESDRVRIAYLGVAECIDEETAETIEIGHYELKYEYHTAKVDSSCEKELTKEAMDIVREAINNYDSTIELKIRLKK